MHTKKNAYLLAIALALFVVLLNVAPQVAYYPVGDDSGLAASTSPSPRIQFHLQDVIIKNNTPPKAEYDSYVTEEDASLIVTAPGVLANDKDANNDSLIAVLTTAPSHGILVFSSDGSFTYTPEPNFFGEDSFNYYVSDGKLDDKPTTVFITVNLVNDAPVAVDDVYETDEDTILAVAAPGVRTNDYDVDLYDFVSAVLVTVPEHGSLVLFIEGDIEYIPDPDWYGTDHFQYQLFDTYVYGNIATVTITVNPVSDAPVAVNDEFTMYEDTVLEIFASDLLNNDYDADGDTLLVTIEDYPFFGTLDIAALQTFAVIPSDVFVYTPNPDWYGVDYFTYRVFDGSEYSALAQVKITVLDVIDDTTPPVITIMYTGDATDGSPGYWTVTVDDPESGIDWITVEIDGVLVGTLSGDYAVPNLLGTHTIEVSAANAVFEAGIEDQGFSTLSATVTIVDDDATGPEIAIVHSGGTTVSDPGLWTVTASDLESGIAALIVVIDGVAVGNATGDYAVPASVGTHNITVTAYNGDTDRGDVDQEVSVASTSIAISRDSEPGFVTGGGWIVDANGNKGHFAFVVRLEPDGDICGVFMYTFKSDRLHYTIVSTEWLAMRIDGNYAYFEAECTVFQYRSHCFKHFTVESGYTVRVDVWDNHGRCSKDIFQIRIYDPSGQTWYEAGYDPLGKVHGAIVIHLDKHHRGHHCCPGRW